MRFRYRVLPPAAPVVGGAPTPGAGPAYGEVEIPTATVATVIASIGGISGLVTLLGFFFRDLPNAMRSGAEAERCARLAVLATALAPADSTARARSLLLVIAADILPDPSGQLAAIARAPGSLPRWIPDSVPVTCAAGRQTGGTTRSPPAQPSPASGPQAPGSQATGPSGATPAAPAGLIPRIPPGPSRHTSPTGPTGGVAPRAASPELRAAGAE